MLAGTKPLSMFVEPVDPDFEYFPEEKFDRLVSEGRLAKHVSFETVRHPDGPHTQVRRVLYALPGEEWRINTMLFVHELYFSLTPGWRPDLERLIGLLLGYEREEIEKFLATMTS
jgi:hypothetical protein